MLIVLVYNVQTEMSLLTFVEDFNASRDVFQQTETDQLTNYVALKCGNVKYYNVRSGILILDSSPW